MGHVKTFFFFTQNDVVFGLWQIVWTTVHVITIGVSVPCIMIYEYWIKASLWIGLKYSWLVCIFLSISVLLNYLVCVWSFKQDHELVWVGWLSRAKIGHTVRNLRRKKYNLIFCSNIWQGFLKYFLLAFFPCPLHIFYNYNRICKHHIVLSIVINHPNHPLSNTIVSPSLKLWTTNWRR